LSIKAYIKEIEECVVHDGPGNRSLVFIKGCSMRCKWCQNPELLEQQPVIWFNKVTCKACGKCKEVCPANAILLHDKLRIDLTKCLGISCSKCVEACPEHAMEVIGHEITAENLCAQLAKYKLFYDGSGGGITLTGGDPLFVPDFSTEVLSLCQQERIHTAIQTALYSSYENIWKVIKHCDLLMCDIKHMDSAKHKEGTGVPNELIHENLKKLNNDFKDEIIVRIPLIPGFNDDEENIAQTAKFLYPLNQVKGIDLLPFNMFPVAKYEALSKDWPYGVMEKQTEKHLNRLQKIIESHNKRFRCTIGGLW